ncbi:iron-containing alcohol dehydrogenase [Methylobacterium indicum]|uniref:Alcohol dehydrogenase n=1 Tax=Methylobacterium indicum TaxID=1775910 RepID=A0ABR5HFY0_9HYPH|nr:iron-containing alcohol dehydrogenase [Methylobacterium indicum]KMO19165.1 alcohol dehydrogenase [Methylobacterium indicum]KMO25488.1 alcohol dehydrogenase [Methylobacterium indicum]
MSYQITLPRIIRIGRGALGETADILSNLRLSKPLIVTDATMVRNGTADRLQAALASAHIESAVFSDTIPEPDTRTVAAVLAAVEAGRFDCLIGLGGGSPIDTAKAVAVLCVQGRAMRDYKAPHQENGPALPIIGIPTTAGTGSEVTRFTVVTDNDNCEKMLCAGLSFLPVAAIVDYELTLSKPPRLTADTGIDALTHAIEAYVSRRANAFSDGFALAAIRNIAPHLRRAYVDGADLSAREALMLGATQAGIAFSNSSVALVHGMSRPIGAHFHVPHGLSNAMLLPAITAYSIPGAEARYADCARAMGLAAGLDDDAAARALVAELRALNADLAVPTPKAYGVDPATWTTLLPTMAQQALASGSPSNNPIIPDVKAIMALYREAWCA